jgi:Ca2+-binding EF-hand superfamily protein
MGMSARRPPWRVGITVSDSEMEAMLREYDADHDGVLSEEEFIMLLRYVPMLLWSPP